MLTYIKNLLPRVQNHSKKLEQIEIFIEKPWVLLQDQRTDDLFEYEFHRNNKTLFAVGGRVSWGTWHLTPTSHRLVLKNAEIELLLETAFVDDSIMILKKSGTRDDYFVFVNRMKVPDLNFQAYFEKTHPLQDNSKVENLQVSDQENSTFLSKSKEKSPESEEILTPLKQLLENLTRQERKLETLLESLDSVNTKRTLLMAEVEETKISLANLRENYQWALVHGVDSKNLIFDPEKNPELDYELKEVVTIFPNFDATLVELYITFSDTRALSRDQLKLNERFVEDLVSGKIPTRTTHLLFSKHNHLPKFKSSLNSHIRNTLLKTP